ncbi:MAG: peptidoglycan editing factor PgeF [Rubrivivax sp.]
MSTRQGGVSAGRHAGLNLGNHVDDAPQAVAANRHALSQALGGVRLQWLRQVHGAGVVRASAATTAQEPCADAAWSDEPGVACCVLVADCLPVLLAADNGRVVGAAHAGWRGLAAGVLEAAVAQLAQGARCEPAQLVAWLGPCIGPGRFEVGEDVVRALGDGPRFVARGWREGGPRWLADLPGLASDRLQAAGVRRVSLGSACTVEDASRFFSYRRDGVTGRLAAAVWLKG